VYLAKTPVWTPVALKVLPREFARDEDRVAGFEREARAVAALRSSRDCVLYEIGELDAVRYLPWNMSRQEPAGELLAVRYRLDRLIDYTTQIADALEHAHASGHSPSRYQAPRTSW